MGGREKTKEEELKQIREGMWEDGIENK